MGYSIPGDAIEIQQMQITSNARFVIIIEKDAIFQRSKTPSSRFNNDLV